MQRILGWLNEKPIYNFKQWQDALNNYIPAGCYNSNHSEYKFIPVRVNAFGVAPTKRHGRSADNWMYSPSGNFRIWDGWMGDLEFKSNGIWKKVNPKWYLDQYTVLVSTPTGTDYEQLFKFIAVKFKLATETDLVIAKDGDFKNLSISNIKVIQNV